MAIPAKNTLGNPNVTEGNFQVAIEQLRESVIGSGKEYDSANTYMQYDTCVYGGVTYYSKINSNTGNTPAIGTNWGDIADLISTVVHKTGAETIAGVKTFSSSPIVPNATTATQAMAYGQGVNLTSEQTIAGVKTFSSSPIVPVPTSVNQVISMGNIIEKTGAGLGYGTGSGGTVTQLTNKSTAVTLNKPSGRIVTSNASMLNNAIIYFTVNNIFMNESDEVVIGTTYTSGLGTRYQVEAIKATGSFVVRLTNISGSTQAENVYLDFAIIKGAIA